MSLGYRSKTVGHRIVSFPYIKLQGNHLIFLCAINYWAFSLTRESSPTVSLCLSQGPACVLSPNQPWGKEDIKKSHPCHQEMAFLTMMAEVNPPNQAIWLGFCLIFLHRPTSFSVNALLPIYSLLHLYIPWSLEPALTISAAHSFQLWSTNVCYQLPQHVEAGPMTLWAKCSGLWTTLFRARPLCVQSILLHSLTHCRGLSVPPVWTHIAL